MAVLPCCFFTFLYLIETSFNIDIKLHLCLCDEYQSCIIAKKRNIHSNNVLVEFKNYNTDAMNIFIKVVSPIYAHVCINIFDFLMVYLEGIRWFGESHRGNHTSMTEGFAIWKKKNKKIERLRNKFSLDNAPKTGDNQQYFEYCKLIQI